MKWWNKDSRVKNYGEIEPVVNRLLYHQIFSAPLAHPANFNWILKETHRGWNFKDLINWPGEYWIRVVMINSLELLMLSKYTHSHLCLYSIIPGCLSLVNYYFPYVRKFWIFFWYSFHCVVFQRITDFAYLKSLSWFL